ncbi:class I SAM-dependent methyltransferase [Nesterenkonia sp. HG001]|uniref:SAM-dependent methyltransferase n=1 Tax=Nesterenkonia sp. HG001 TaxID=2983207 RepID=UPI002AC5754E|nr:class I SAM-dependent methyltransferase [Nesterenkonia sp. HG001]MDZ5076347.1 class I SAM-dependent methyltransferase [Nesterenkonia sp. HG001]
MPHMETPITSQDATGPSGPPVNGLDLAFGSPMSVTRSEQLITELTEISPRRIIDVGCGWAEQLLRTVMAVPGAHGLGVDLEEQDILRGQERAARLGVQDRVELRVQDGVELAGTAESADALICLGSWHALGGSPAAALLRLRGLAAPGTRLLFGVDHWARLPDQDRLAQMWEGASLSDSHLLPDVVEAAAQAGWRLLDLHEATVDEWNHFECGMTRNQEEWLLENPDHPEAPALRERLDTLRGSWLRGHHGYMGFATLVLAAGSAHGESGTAISG